MSKPTNNTAIFGGAFASVAGQRIAMTASKWKSGFGGGLREYPSPRALGWLLGGFADWLDWVDGVFLADGRPKQQTKTLQIAPAAFAVTAGTSTSVDATALNGNGLSAITGIALPTGKRITAIRVKVDDSSTGPTKVAIGFTRSNNDHTYTVLASSSQSAGNHTVQTLSITGLTETIASGKSYSITAVTVTGTGLVSILGAEVDYDELV